MITIPEDNKQKDIGTIAYTDPTVNQSFPTPLGNPNQDIDTEIFLAKNPEFTKAPAVNPVQQEVQTEQSKQEHSIMRDALVTDNSAGSVLNYFNDRPDLIPEPGYFARERDPELYNGLPLYMRAKLDKSNSTPESHYIVKRYFEEVSAHQRLDDAGGWGTVARFASGLGDPTNMFPIVGQSTKIKALWAAGTAAVDEAVLQSTQDTRTTTESLVNIGTAGVFTYTLSHLADRWGGHNAIKPLLESVQDTHDQPDLVDLLDEIDPIDFQPKIPLDAGSAATPHISMEDNKLVGGSVAEILTVGTGANLLTSKLNSFRNIAHNLVDHAFITQGDKKGLKRSVSLESEIVADRNRMLGSFTNAYHEELDKWATRTGGKRDEFDNIVTSIARNDPPGGVNFTHNVDPEVQRVGLMARQMFSEIGQRLHQAGLLADPNNVRGAMYYVPRLYDKYKIALNSDAFKTTLVRGFERQWMMKTPEQQQVILDKYVTTDLRTAARDVADEVYETIMSGADEFKAMNERVVTLDDVDLAPWLHNDPMLLANRYMDKYLPKVIFQEKFGVNNFEDFLKIYNIEDEADALKKANPNTAMKIEKHKNEMKEEVKVLYNRLMNIKEPVKYKGINEVAENVKKIIGMQNLGMVTLTSMTDLARLITINGPMKFLQYEFKNLIASIPGSNMSKKEMKILVAAFEDIQNTRINQISDIVDDFDPTNPISRAITLGHNKFMRVTGLPQWTTFHKIVAGHIASDKIITIGNKLASGKKMSKSDIVDMTKLGLDESMLKRIAEQYKTYGADTELNLHKWKDRNAAEYMRIALPRYVDKTINTIKAGELPSWMDNRGFKFLMQFQSFAMAAWNQTLIAGLQKSDANFYVSVAVSLGIAAAVTKMKNELTGTPDPEDWDGWARTAVDRSGFASLLFDAYNRIGGTVGAPTFGSIVDHITDPNAKHPQSRGPDWTRALGPSGRLLSNAHKAFVEPLLTGTYDQDQISATRRLAPTQNLVGWNLVVDQIEKGLAAMAGIKYEPKDTFVEGLLN